MYNLIRGALFHGFILRDCGLHSAREVGKATWRQTDTEIRLLDF